ncbi:hypothetical protein Tco_0687960 [Tanacetum coccineum]
MRNHRGAIAWSVANIKGIDSSFYTHKILMEDEYKPTVQPQRRPIGQPRSGRPEERRDDRSKERKEQAYTLRHRYFQIPIAPEDQEKTTFTFSYGTSAYKRMPFGLCNAPPTFQRCMIAIFYELIKGSMEVFMYDFLVFGISFDHCLANLEKMLERCEETNLVLNWLPFYGKRRDSSRA